MSDTAITIPKSSWLYMVKRLDAIEKTMEVANWVSEKQAMAALDLEETAIRNYSCPKGKFIKGVHFKKDFLGHKIYNLKAIKGL